MSDARRRLPSVSALLESAALRPLLDRGPRALVVDAVRATIDATRTAGAEMPETAEQWAQAVAVVVARAEQPSLRRVLNGTGVVLHTNLGRAPLAAAAVEAIARVAAGFSNLEYDLAQGTRGTRYVHCASLLRELTGAEDAVVVNNGAAALVLVLNTFAAGREAILSRGELIEIGGSFRIPDIMEKSGARLVEVGTTNRTRADDYARAATSNTGAIVTVHRSNFAVAGFVGEASTSELAAIARKQNVPMLYDLGSGLLLPLDDLGLSGEPTARQALDAGATIVTMSGDKLLGGPQAGIIVGAREAIAAIRDNPLTRSYRVDKLTLAALEATLALYRDPPRALREIPTLAQLSARVDDLRARAEQIAQSVGAENVSVVDSEASVGGGAFPTARIPSVALSLGGHASDLERCLRANSPAVIARIAEGRVLVDLRTILPGEDALLATALQNALQDTQCDRRIGVPPA